MARRGPIAGALLLMVLAGCGGNDASPRSEQLPRVDVRAGHNTDISALPTVAPPPPLKVEAKSGETDARPVETPASTPTPTPDVVSVDPIPDRGNSVASKPPPASTPGESLGPEQGGG